MHQSPEPAEVTRHYARLAEHQLHFRLAGSGPPLLLLHQSPSSSAAMMSEITRFAPRFTVISPDTPGFGLSTSLGVVDPDLDDYARVLAEFLDVLGLSQIAIYGFHTGAMLALEFARRYPQRCAAAVINGLVVVEGEELADILANYLVQPDPDPEGGHLPWHWARIRDQMLFFPWYRKTREARLSLDLPAAEITQPHVVDLFRADRAGRDGYRAAFAYPTAERLPQVTTPLAVLNSSADPIAGHPERLTGLPKGTLREIFDDHEALHARAENFLLQHVTSPVELPRMSFGRASANLRAECFNTATGALHVLMLGEEDKPALMLLHDLAAEAASLTEVAEALADDYCVLVPDLPGQGETGALREAGLTPADQLTPLLAVLDQLGIENLCWAGLGASSFLVMEAAAHHPDRCKSALMVDPWLFTPEQCEDLAAGLDPGLAPTLYGEHLSRAWYWVRDGELFWPWFRAEAATALAREPDLDPGNLQRRFEALLKAAPTFSSLVRDLLAYPSAEALAAIHVPVHVGCRAGGGHEARAARVAGLAGAEPPSSLSGEPAEWTSQLAHWLRSKAK